VCVCVQASLVERATTAPHPAAPSHAHVVAPPRVVGFISREHSARATALRATRRGRSAPPAPSSVHVEAAHVSMLRNTREMLMPDISMLRNTREMLMPDISMLRNTREMLMPDISMLRNTREMLMPDSEAAVFGDGYAPASAMDVTSSNAVRVSQKSHLWIGNWMPQPSQPQHPCLRTSTSPSHPTVMCRVPPSGRTP
jgi:hypothetical protein